uniref:Uncharacterized protein n=1 Tax=Nothoprocta perdicaria TaxID=30464 RepID=A0A8C6ZWA8_NOTPE
PFLGLLPTGTALLPFLAGQTALQTLSIAGESRMIPPVEMAQEPSEYLSHLTGSIRDLNLKNRTSPLHMC